MAFDPVVEVNGWPVNSSGEIVFKKGSGDTNVVGVLPINFIPADTLSGKIAAVFEGVGGGSAGATSGVAIAGLGDSITQQNSGIGASDTSISSIGYLNWLCVLSKGRAYYDNGLNFGVSGENVAQILARAPAAITTMVARGVKFCVVHGGTNDINGTNAASSTPAATLMTNYTQIITLLLAAGITPIVIPVLPRSYGAAGPIVMSATSMILLQRIATAQRNLARNTPGVLLADPALEVTNYANASGYPIGTDATNIMGQSPAVTTAYTYDGLHPAPRMAFCMGKALLAVLEPYLGTIPLLTYSPADTFDATYNPNGNLLSNGGIMLGTNGTLGTAASGVVAAGWTANRQTGTALTVVASKGTLAIGSNTIPTQVLTLSGATAAGERVRFTNGANVVVGDLIYAEMEVSISNVTAGSLDALQLTLFDGGGTYFAYGNRRYTGKYLPDNSWTGVIRTPVMTAPATGMFLSLEAYIDGTVASNGATITVIRAAIRKGVVTV